MLKPYKSSMPFVIIWNSGKMLFTNLKDENQANSYNTFSKRNTKCIKMTLQSVIFTGNMIKWISKNNHVAIRTQNILIKLKQLS